MSSTSTATDSRGLADQPERHVTHRPRPSAACCPHRTRWPPTLRANLNRTPGSSPTTFLDSTSLRPGRLFMSARPSSSRPDRFQKIVRGYRGRRRAARPMKSGAPNLVRSGQTGARRDVGGSTVKTRGAACPPRPPASVCASAIARLKPSGAAEPCQPSTSRDAPGPDSSITRGGSYRHPVRNPDGGQRSPASGPFHRRVHQSASSVVVRVEFILA